MHRCSRYLFFHSIRLWMNLYFELAHEKRKIPRNICERERENIIIPWRSMLGKLLPHLLPNRYTCSTCSEISFPQIHRSRIRQLKTVMHSIFPPFSVPLLTKHFSWLSLELPKSEGERIMRDKKGEYLPDNVLLSRVKRLSLNLGRKIIEQSTLFTYSLHNISDK